MTLYSVVNIFNILKISVMLRRNSGTVLFSKINFLIMKKLTSLGYILNFALVFLNSRVLIKFSLFSSSGFIQPLQGVRLLCSPNVKNCSLSVRELQKSNFGAGVLLLSTKKGVLTKSEALNLNLGGLPLISVW